MNKCGLLVRFYSNDSKVPVDARVREVEVEFIANRGRIGHVDRERGHAIDVNGTLKGFADYFLISLTGLWGSQGNVTQLMKSILGPIMSGDRGVPWDYR